MRNVIIFALVLAFATTAFADLKNATLDFDVQMRFNDYGWDTPAVEQINNDNHFEHLLGINLKGAVAEDMAYNLRWEKYGYFNSTGGDWGVGRGVFSQADTDLRTSLAYLEVTDFFGWADYARLGRQPVQVGYFVDGVADGLVFQKSVSEWQNGVFTLGMLALDGADADANNDNDGLGLWYLDYGFVPTHSLQGHAYYIHSKNSFASVTAPTINRAQAAMMDGFAKSYGYAGLSLDYTGIEDLLFYGEFVLSNWEESLQVDNSLKDGDNAFIAGVSWKATDKLNVETKFMVVDKYFFAPSNAAGNNIFDTDTYLHDDLELWNVAGYNYDFDTWLIKLAYQLDDKVNLLGVYEAIDDNTGAVVADDRNVITGKVSYRYNDNAVLSFLARHIGTSDNTSTAVVTRVANGAAIYGNAGGANTGAAGEVNVDDVTLYRVQVSISF